MRAPLIVTVALLAAGAANAAGAPNAPLLHGLNAQEHAGRADVRLVLHRPATITATITRIVTPGRERTLRRMPGEPQRAGKVTVPLGPLPGGAWRVHLRAIETDGRVSRYRVGLRVPTRLTIAASGDLLMHGSLIARSRQLGGGRHHNVVPMLAPIAPVIRAADAALCQTETPIGGGAPQGYPIFRAPGSLADAIRATGWDICSTASNHTLDGGSAGIRATLGALDRVGVRHTGAARSAAEADRPVILDVGGVPVGFVAATEHTNGIPRPHPWSVRPATAAAIRAQVARTRRAGARAVIVNVHWGEEYQHAPSAFQRSLAAALVKIPGVTAVVGQHVHVVQPIRYLGGVPVVYGEGNLLAGQFGNRQDGLIALLRLEVPPAGTARVVRVDYVPTHVAWPELTVRPVAAGDGGEQGASWRRTVAVVGRSNRVGPLSAANADRWP